MKCEAKKKQDQSEKLLGANEARLKAVINAFLLHLHQDSRTPLSPYAHRGGLEVRNECVCY